MSTTKEDPQPAPVSKKNKYRKEKPWDTDDIDKWKIEPFQEGEMKSPLLEESTFATLFPRYKEQYLRDVWPEIQQALEPHGILAELNLVEGTMTVKTTRKTWDPYMIIKARDLIRLLSRGVPAPQAVKILGDEITCDIIKIGGLVRNKDRFVKRRQRLMGPNGETLKALELLTNCYIFIQGNTVSAMGTFKNLKILRRIVVDCMENVHPIYHIKTLMIKKELEKDPELAKENWDRFLPQFKKKNLKRKSANKTEKKAPYTPFPPAPVMSKIDKQLESGEYFLSPEQKQAKDLEAKTQKSAEKKKIRTEKYNEGFVPPKEPVKSNAKIPKTVETRSASDIAASLLQKTGSKRGRPQEEAQVAAEPKSKIQKTDRDGSKKRRK